METTIGVTKEQAFQASQHYLNATGYEIEGTWESDSLCGLVASDESGLAFVQVQYQDNDGAAENGKPNTIRHEFECAAVNWLADNEDCYDADFPVRFDAISFLLVSRKRALLRHQVNALRTC